MTSRLLPLLALLSMGGIAHASEPISIPVSGASAKITQPHVTAELIPQATLVYAGQPFDVILHLHMDEHWHTYWINPGDAGLATSIKWTLPSGLTAGPIQWPTPEKHAMGPLTTYGYGGDVYLLTTITPEPGAVPAHGAAPISLKAHATWLVCQEECIPGKGDFEVKGTLAAQDAALDFQSYDNRSFFKAAHARLPVPNTRWDVTAAYQGDQLALIFKPKPGERFVPTGKLAFFAEQPNVVGTKDNDLQSDGNDAAEVELHAHLALAQNGEKPDHLSGVLVSDQALIGEAKAIYLTSFPVTNGATAETHHPEPVEGSVPSGAPPATVAPSFLLAVLGAAFLGGLILNLMPCVLPVLSLKVFSLIKHAGENSGTAWRQGVAFTAGVVVSFWVLAGLLLALRAAGQHLGWGFQMQSPGFVLALTFLFFLLGLNLFGVFELGVSLVGLDAKASSHLGGLTSSFANGALATLAATPCTAPFMGSSVGFAAQQPPFIALLVFTFLALGMAAPYLLLTTFPGALRLVPRPGPWMEALRQFMGFLLMGTVIFLVYVFGALVGEERVPSVLGTLLLAGLAAWIFGRWSSPVHGVGARVFSLLTAAIILIAAGALGAGLAKKSPVEKSSWQTYSPQAVQEALAAGRPVFVDFTAAWCLSCKVNERIALDVDSTKLLFAQKNVALFRGDWTQNDPEISKTLRQYNRDGVPLYLLYSPKNPTKPQVLPELLTPGIVQDAILGLSSDKN